MRTSFSDEWNIFTSQHEKKRIDVDGVVFEYYSVGDDGNPPLVFLNGGMNCPEMWMGYLDSHLIDDYRAIIFEYPRGARTNLELVDAMNSFFRKIGVDKPVLIGASYGGMVAQMYQKRFRGELSGIVLIATGGLDKDTLRKLRRKYRFLGLLLWYMKHSDYEKMKPKLIKVGDNLARNENEEDRAYVHEMFEYLFRYYSKEKDMHITSLQADIGNQTPLEKEDFVPLMGRILLIFPSDDFFSPDMQHNLEEMMLSPDIIRLTGSHASTMIRPEVLLSSIVTFLRRIGY